MLDLLFTKLLKVERHNVAKERHAEELASFFNLFDYWLLLVLKIDICLERVEELLILLGVAVLLH